MAKVKMITLEELMEMQENGAPFTLVETLDEEVYNQGHIPGAINIPSAEIVRGAKQKLEKHATIITYCASYTCHASTVAARKLADIGYSDVLDFKGGKKLWTEAGLDLEQ